MDYSEHATPGGGPVTCVWARDVADAAEFRIVPDACADLIFNGERLWVAGPDPRGPGAPPRHRTGPRGAASPGRRLGDRHGRPARVERSAGQPPVRDRVRLRTQDRAEGVALPTRASPCPQP